MTKFQILKRGKMG